MHVISEKAAAFIVVLILCLGPGRGAAVVAGQDELVYMQYTSENMEELGSLMALNVSAAGPQPNVIHSYGQQIQPRWMQTSASFNTTWVNSFPGENFVTGTVVGFDVGTKQPVFKWHAPYFWRMAIDPQQPETLYGLHVAVNNVQLIRMNLTSGATQIIGQFDAGYVQPCNSAAYDSLSRVFYAFLYGDQGTLKLFGMDVGSGKVVTNVEVDSSLYICKAEADPTTGALYVVAMPLNAAEPSVWLARVDTETGKVSAVGEQTWSVFGCGNDSTLWASQRLFVGSLQTQGSSVMTFWRMEDGAIVRGLTVINECCAYIYGLELFSG